MNDNHLLFYFISCAISPCSPLVARSFLALCAQKCEADFDRGTTNGRDGTLFLKKENSGGDKEQPSGQLGAVERVIAGTKSY